MVYVWLAVTFCVCLVTSNLFVPRLWQVGKWPLQLSGAVVIFPISYIINDLLTEVYGYRKAMRVIWMGFILSAFVALAAQLVCWLPAPIYPESQEVADSFNRLFGLNQQGTEIVRPSMYCNKYPWEKAKDLFGKVAGYGAQIPQ